MAKPEPIVAITADGVDLTASSYGAKAVGLQKLMRLGLRVPPAFVVSVEAAPAVASGDHRPLLQSTVAALAASKDDRLAVRSGAEFSLPGAFETMLDVVPEVTQAAVAAVVESSHGLRVSTIAAAMGHDRVPETAVVIQRQVDATLDSRSGSGAASSRHPVTGVRGVNGSFVWQTSGDAVMAGTVPVMALDAMASRLPDVFEELSQALARLDRELDSAVELEFTVESGVLWHLQLRQFVVTPPDADQLPGRAEVLASGLAASAGIGYGFLHVDVDDALDAIEAGQPVVLAIETSSPADVGAMTKVAGVMTVLGGRESHAAVVTRSAGVPAVLAVQGLEIGADHIVLGGRRVDAGTELWVDGTTGRVAGLRSRP